jgi:hypothetical protein
MTRFEPQPDPDTLRCDDPAHPSDCVCGADPDAAYEDAIERELEADR